MSERRSGPVLLVAATTGYQIRSFGEAAAALGLRLVIASDRCDHLEDPWQDAAIPVRFHDPVGSVEHLVAAMRERPSGILAVGDRPTVLAAHAAAAFGLPGNPPAAAERSRNKLAARDSFRAAGLRMPVFEVVPSGVDPVLLAFSVRYPAVIKPLALSGSRGVMRVDDAQAFTDGFARLRRLLAAADVRVQRDAANDLVLIESFIPGREFAVEGVLTGGTFQPFAIFDKPDPLDGPFFEETIYVTPSRAPEAVQAAILETVAAASRALGLVHGPVHAECRVNDAGVFVLEVAARPIGGLCSRALRFADPDRRPDAPGVSLEHVLLLHAAGDDVSGVVPEAGASGVMMIPIPAGGVLRGVDGVEAGRAVPGVDDIRITARIDAVLTPLPEGRSYLGFIFARGATPAAVEEALREAHRRLRFTIDRALPVLPGSVV